MHAHSGLRDAVLLLAAAPLVYYAAATFAALRFFRRGQARGSRNYTPPVSLLKPVSESGPGKRRPGMEGFLIQEVALKGIVKDKTGFVAMLLGTDGKSYFCRVGQRLFDGQITAIDAATVTFRQEVTDPLSSVRARDVKKTLYPSEEGRQ